MALTASYPVIEDLAMKFNRHSLHDSFQLPTFYSSSWQAKEFALYLQPGFIVDPSFDQTVPFEFKANGTFTTKKNNRNKLQSDRTSSTKHSPRHSPKREQVKGNKAQTIIDPAHSSDNKEHKSNAVKNLHFDEDCLSDDEELSCYFSKETELCHDRFLPTVESSPTRNHNRKRSMEDEECTTIKRCCRPRLNFDKMLLNSRDSLENTWSVETDTTNYFRPISPQDLLS